MLEYFTYKKYKKHKAEKAREEQERLDRIREEKGKAPEDPPNVVLDPADEEFFAALISADGPAPPLPPRSELAWESSTEVPRSGEQSAAGSADEASSAAEKSDRDEKKDKKKKTKKGPRSMIPFFKKKDEKLLSPADVSPEEEAKEERDISRILRTLNLAADKDRAIPLSAEVSSIAHRFTQILKDLANGVPTAYNDLIRLIEDRDGLLDRTFEKLPSGLQKLVMQLPEKVTSSIAPDVLAAAAKAQGVEVAKEAGLKEAAMSLLTVRGLQEMVTKPGALAAMLRSIVEALKLRFPAFMGTNLLWSVAIFLLLFVIWYCHKRGKEERLKKEDAANESRAMDEISIEELSDAPRDNGRIEGGGSVPRITGPDSDAGEGSTSGGQRAGDAGEGSSSGVQRAGNGEGSSSQTAERAGAGESSR